MSPERPPLTDPRRKRLAFQCRHRGMREMDMILGHFADRHLAALEEAELDTLETLLSLPDQAMYRWICGTEAVPDIYRTPVWDLVADIQDLPSLWSGQGGRRP